MFGWKRTFLNLHLGGFEGNSSLKSIVNLYVYPSHIVEALPGIPHSHLNMLSEPSGLVAGAAEKPGGRSLLQFFLSSASLAVTIAFLVDIYRKGRL